MAKLWDTAEHIDHPKAEPVYVNDTNLSAFEGMVSRHFGTVNTEHPDEVRAF